MAVMWPFVLMDLAGEGSPSPYSLRCHADGRGHGDVGDRTVRLPVSHTTATVA